MPTTHYYGTGRRKTSVARVFLIPGDNTAIKINNKEVDIYFRRSTHAKEALAPLELIPDKTFGLNIFVKGGGYTGQAGAVKMGLSRALLELNPDHRDVLKSAGYLTRDSRAVERKKYGMRGARARFQYSKR